MTRLVNSNCAYERRGGGAIVLKKSISDMTQTLTSLGKLRPQAIRHRLGTAQSEVRRLRFKGLVRNVERDVPRSKAAQAICRACAIAG